LIIRRTLNALKGLAWGSVWNIGANVLEERYRVMSRQFESLRHLSNIVTDWNPASLEEIQTRQLALDKLRNCSDCGHMFAEWYITLRKGKPVTTIEPLYFFELELASTAGFVLTTLLLPAWQKETQSLLFDPDRGPRKSGSEGQQTSEVQGGSTASAATVPPLVSAAEEFFVLPYLSFIQNTLGRIRTIVLGSLCIFVSATLAVSSYPFEPIPVLGGVFLLLFLGFGATLTFVYAEMHRDATLSHLTNTTPGELGGHFWLQLFTFGIGPLLGLLTTLFPSMTDFIMSWIQPSAQAIK